jgi:hypothetical protein
MMVDLLVIKTRIIWPDTAQIKECAEVLKEVKLDTGPDQTASQNLEYHDTWKMSPISVTANHHRPTVMEATMMALVIINYEFHLVYA